MATFMTPAEKKFYNRVHKLAAEYADAIVARRRALTALRTAKTVQAEINAELAVVRHTKRIDQLGFRLDNFTA